MTAPANLPKRADELEPDMRASVSASRTMAVSHGRPGVTGKVDIRWNGSDPWASVPADRLFDMVSEVVA